MTTARGVRNRNPGNIIVSGWTQRQDGYLGPEPEGRFARFDTMAHGVRALLRLLLVYRDQHKLKTVRQIINRWAPSSENDTGSYVMSVAKAIGVGIDDDLPADAETYIRLARAIVAHENGRDQAVAVTDEDYAEAASTLQFSQPAGTLPQAPSVSSPAPAPAAPDIQFPGLEGGLPPAPKPRSGAPAMPIPAIVSAAASALLPLVSDMMRARGSKTSERNAAVVDAAAPVLIEIAKKVVPVGANEQEVAEAILADKSLQQKFRAEVALRWADVAPAFEHDAAERKAARDFMLEATSSGPAWRQMGAGFVVAAITLAIIIGGGLMFYELLGSDTLDSGQKGMVLGALLAAFASAVQYWLGTTASSRVKDATISEQVRKG